MVTTTPRVDLLLRHVSAERADVYRAIINVFSAAKRQFRLHLRPDEVRAEADWPSGAMPRDGHLLLRGNNGTGKSKVLSLTLPFLPDVSLSAARVEPNGDRSKRMEWNLLMWLPRCLPTWLTVLAATRVPRSARTSKRHASVARDRSAESELAHEAGRF